MTILRKKLPCVRLTCPKMEAIATKVLTRRETTRPMTLKLALWLRRRQRNVAWNNRSSSIGNRNVNGLIRSASMPMCNFWRRSRQLARKRGKGPSRKGSMLSERPPKRQRSNDKKRNALQLKRSKRSVSRRRRERSKRLVLPRRRQQRPPRPPPMKPRQNALRRGRQQQQRPPRPSLQRRSVMRPQRRKRRRNAPPPRPRLLILPKRRRGNHLISIRRRAGTASEIPRKQRQRRKLKSKEKQMIASVLSLLESPLQRNIRRWSNQSVVN
mmetsp:Transcript_32850/g.96880  ORF Transcript_32850/g.96880 Transcript_32850/m.96880 type:complete len:269 (+) Transcript_32850:3538-4344(+)